MFSIICGILRYLICIHSLFAVRVCNTVDVFGLLAFCFHYICNIISCEECVQVEFRMFYNASAS